MPERPDLRLIAGNIREALAGFEREQLLDILTYVFKEYVVEGPPPLLVHQAERLTDLEGLSFPQLIGALQTRLDLVELSLFSVEGEQVFVRLGGVKTALTGADAAAAARQSEPAAEARPPAAAGQPAQPTAQQPQRPQPGVYVVETGRMTPPAQSERPSVDEAVERGRADIAGLEQRRGVAPRPSGLSVRGRPGGAGGGGAMAPEGPPEPPAAPAPQQPAAPAAKPATATDGDDASVRFSLLELD
ncbi:MAG TPA: hypothetical protein VL172_04950 [Kofleriaceae bacterium]|jgi:hypothetical protein|nr:hypothetical protein [Kofleriaceae bacterium]